MEGNQWKDEMYIDFADDLLIASHLSYFGSVKYIRYLAEWIQGNISLADRRGNAVYNN